MINVFNARNAHLKSCISTGWSSNMGVLEDPLLALGDFYYFFQKNNTFQFLLTNNFLHYCSVMMHPQE